MSLWLVLIVRLLVVGLVGDEVPVSVAFIARASRIVWAMAFRAGGHKVNLLAFTLAVK